MPLLFPLLLVAHAQTARVELVLHNRRPSSLLQGVKGLGASLVADDARSVVAISGTPAQVDATREYLKLMDSPRRTLLVRVTIDSPADHLRWEVDARLVSGQRWRTSDDETASEIVLIPRLDGDGRLVAELAGRCHGTALTSSMRLGKGEARTVTFGKRTVQRVQVGPSDKVFVSEIDAPLPTVTLRYVGG